MKGSKAQNRLPIALSAAALVVAVLGVTDDMIPFIPDHVVPTACDLADERSVLLRMDECQLLALRRELLAEQMRGLWPKPPFSDHFGLVPPTFDVRFLAVEKAMRLSKG